MKWLVGFCLSALVHALVIGAIAWSLRPPPAGEVFITDLTTGTRVTVDPVRRVI